MVGSDVGMREKEEQYIRSRFGPDSLKEWTCPPLTEKRTCMGRSKQWAAERAMGNGDPYRLLGLSKKSA